MRNVGFAVLAALSVGMVGCQMNTTPSRGYQAQILRPQDFQNGQVTVTLKNLGSNESVAVIPVNAEQLLDPDGFTYTLNVSNVQAPPVAAEQELLQPQGVQSRADQLRLQAHEKHLQFMGEQKELLKDIKKQGIQPLNRSTVPKQQAFNTCSQPKLGDKCKYWVWGAGDQEQITTSLRFVSKNAYWFVDDRDLADLTDPDLSSFAKVFEEKLFLTDARYFGTPADLDGNGKIKIVFSRTVGKLAFGYVSVADFYPDAELFPGLGFHSNEGDIFYSAVPSSFLPRISRESMLSYDLPSTLVHELKHLISSGQRFVAEYEDEDGWTEEASAVAAEELSGYGTQMGNYAKNMSARGLISPQNVRVYLPWNLAGDESGNFYGYNFLMMWRLAEQKGHDKFWKPWTVNPKSGMANLTQAAGKPMADIMLDWAQVLMFSNTGIAPQFDYQSLNLRDGLPNGTSWRQLGYRPLKNLKDTARSMAYYVGRGTGKDVTITLKTDHAAPYLIVSRFKGNLPWGSATTLAGTIKVPTGQSAAGLTLVACMLENGVCGEASPIRDVPVRQKGTEATFSVTGLRPGQYSLEAFRDVNENGIQDAGDLYGCVRNGQTCAKLTLNQDELVLNVEVLK